MADILNDRYDIFFQVFSETGNVAEACRVAHTNRRNAYAKRDTDKAFAERWEEAVEAFLYRIEREALRRAVEGTDEPVIHQGRLSYEYQLDAKGRLIKDEDGVPLVAVDENGKPKHLSIRKYSDSLLQTMLKGNLPGKYRENTTIKLGNDGESFKVEESPTAAARKIAFALAMGLRAAKDQTNSTESDSDPLAGDLDGSDLV